MLKRGNGKTYQLYKKMQKSFSKVLDIKLVYLKKFAASQLRSFAAEGGLCPNKFKYQLLKLRPKTARQ